MRRNFHVQNAAPKKPVLNRPVKSKPLLPDAGHVFLPAITHVSPLTTHSWGVCWKREFSDKHLFSMDPATTTVSKLRGGKCIIGKLSHPLAVWFQQKSNEERTDTFLPPSLTLHPGTSLPAFWGDAQCSQLLLGLPAQVSFSSSIYKLTRVDNAFEIRRGIAWVVIVTVFIAVGGFDFFGKLCLVHRGQNFVLDGARASPKTRQIFRPTDRFCFERPSIKRWPYHPHEGNDLYYLAWRFVVVRGLGVARGIPVV